MNERRTHEFLPFVIKYRTRSNSGGWGHWHVREPRYWCQEDRDAAFLKLQNRHHVEYECTTDMAELDGQLRAMERLK